MYCVNCGALVDLNSTFCLQCGHRFENDRTLHEVQGLPKKSHSILPRKILILSIISIPVVLLSLIFISVLSNNELSDARKILQEAGLLATEIQDIFPRAQTLLHIAEAQARAGDRTAMVVTFKRALEAAAGRKDDLVKIEDWKWIAASQAKAGDKTAAARTFQQAFQTATEIKEGGLKCITLASLAEAQAEAGDHVGAKLSIQRALEVAAVDSSFDKRVCLPNIALAQARIGDINGALQTAASLAKKEQLLLLIARAQAEANDFTGALQTAALIAEGHGAKVFALVNIALAQAKSNRRDDAREMLRGAFQTATSIANEYSNADDYSKALAFEFIAEAQAEIGDRTAASVSVQEALRAGANDPRALDIIASAQAKMGDINGAMQTITTIKHKGLKASAWPSIVCAHAERGNMSEALGILAQIDSDICDYYGACPSTCIAEAQAEHGDIKAALATASMIKESSRDNALRRVAAAQARGGDVKGALSWIESQSSPSVKSSALLGVAEGILERVETRKAKTTKASKS